MAQERARQKELAKRAVAEPSFYLEQKKVEYKVTPFIKPIVEAGVVVYKKEMEKEEAVVKESWESEVKGLETEAREAFEKDVAAAKQAAPEGVTTAEITAWEKEQKATFESSLSEWKTGVKEDYETYIMGWRAQWKPASFAERMMAWKVPTTPKDWLIGKYGKKAPLAPWAGIVGSVESFVYGVTGLTGLKTPRPPPTFTGGLIAKHIFGKPEELSAVFGEEWGKEYAGGTIIGDVFTTIVLGKGIEKVAKPILSPVFQRVVKPAISPVTRRIREAWMFTRPAKALYKAKLWRIEHLPTYKGSRLDIFMGKFWGKPKIKGVAEVMWQPAKEGYIYEPFKLGAKRVSVVDVAWSIMQTPKTAGVSIAPIVGVAPPKTALTILGKYGVAGYLGVGEPMFTKEQLKHIQAAKWGFKQAPTVAEIQKYSLLPLLTQAQVTRLGILPYVPKFVGIGKRIIAGAPTILGGAAILTGMKGFQVTRVKPTLRKPKVLEKPTIKPAVGSFLNEILKPSLAPLGKEKEKLAPALKAAQVQAAKTTLLSSFIFGKPSPVRPFEPFILRKERKRKKKKKTKKSRKAKPKLERYAIVYPVATTSQVGRWIFGGTPKKRRR